ncbi:unnamed protein product [Sphagnum troendelagicum]|uniref:Uncharacterized protein n=1 Tax=Sphagnum troendelagicum TaxID=128251 RepID=A0ABP0UZJ8_9BRYO
MKTMFVNNVIFHNSLLGRLTNHGVTTCILLSDVCNVTLRVPNRMHSNVIMCTSMHDCSSKLDLEDNFRTMCPEKKVDPLVEGDRGATQVCRILSYAGLAVAQPSQAAASVFKSWQASKAVCEEQPEFDDSSGAVEVCVSHSDPARSSLQLLAAVYSVNCEIEDD